MSEKTAFSLFISYTEDVGSEFLQYLASIHHNTQWRILDYSELHNVFWFIFKNTKIVSNCPCRILFKWVTKWLIKYLITRRRFLLY